LTFIINETLCERVLNAVKKHSLQYVSAFTSPGVSSFHPISAKNKRKKHHIHDAYFRIQGYRSPWLARQIETWAAKKAGYI